MKIDPLIDSIEKTEAGINPASVSFFFASLVDGTLSLCESTLYLLARSSVRSCMWRPRDVWYAWN